MSVINHQQNTNMFYPSNPSQTLTVNGDIASDPVCLDAYSLFSIQHVWSGFTGSWNIIIEGSNIQGPKNDNDYSIIYTTVVNSAEGNAMLNFEKAAFSFVRVRVDYASGGGTLRSVLNGKIW